MTSIESTVSRRTRFPFANYGKDKVPIIATLHTEGSQGDFLTLRLLRRREGYSIDLVDLYGMLVRNAVMKKRMEKVRSKKKSVKRFIRLTQ